MRIATKCGRSLVFELSAERKRWARTHSPMLGRHSRAVALAGAAAAVLASTPAIAHAEEEQLKHVSCPVVAAAQGVQLMVSKGDDLFLSSPSGIGVPVAQSCVDYGVRISTGFASNPYPGEVVRTTPGLLGSVTGAPIPGYPAHVSSSYPANGRAKSERPGYSLTSISTETSSSAKALAGTEPDSPRSMVATAKSVVDLGRRQAAATSTSDTQPLTVEDVLQLGRVQSVATAKVGADGKISRSSELKIGRTEVGGQVVEITPDGVEAAGESAPLRQGNPAEALEAAGVDVRYLAEEKTSRGVLSAGIEVIARPKVQDGEIAVHYTFGRSFAAAAPVEGRRSSADDSPGPDPGVGSARDGGAGAASAFGSVDSGAPMTGEQAPAGAKVPADPAAPAVAAPEQVGLLGDPVDMGMAGMYLVIVFAALAMFASGTLLRLLGVKARWTS